MRRALYAIVLAGGLASACYVVPYDYYGYEYGYGPSYYSYGTDDYGYGPDVAYVAPGVEAVVGYDYPVFWADNAFWLWSGGVWFTSAFHNHGFVHARFVPHSIAHIDHPESFAHFHPATGVHPATGFHGGFHGGFRGGPSPGFAGPHGGPVGHPGAPIHSAPPIAHGGGMPHGGAPGGMPHGGGGMPHGGGGHR
jgi:hypothetical protein